MSDDSYRIGEAEHSPAVDRDMCRRIARQLSDTFKGELIGPTHTAYEDACHVWNGMVDKRPGLILRCTCTEDVVAAVNAARALHLPPSVRGGGHSVSGKALSEGGLTIDLGGMRRVSVDTGRKHVHAEGGCLLADVDEATARHGLIVPAGTVSETGIGGLALGGGIGWLSRKHGLTCDQFVSLELVLASGEVIEVSATGHSDLFWALKGGGGNFGVVTRFTFKAHTFGPMMHLGVSFYEPDDAAEALREYARIVPSLPRTVGWHASLKSNVPHLPFVRPDMVGKRMLMLVAMWLDDANAPEGHEIVERLIRIGKSRVATTNTIPFASSVQRLIDEEFGSGHRYYTKEAHVIDLADEAIDTLVDFWKDMPMHGEIEVINLGGAVSDIAEEASAFSHRQYLLWLNFAMRWDDPLKDRDYIEQIKKVAGDLRHWVGKGIYTNMLNFDEQDRVIEALGGSGKYAKLGRIKAKYDPTNFFRVNCNIEPS
ncbi:FAD/FMN-containing dehydrogenase [Luteibacter rhizovicinus]|uniref:FAD/FMN-containing dehydrogenase n=1 Tax=Luteibacter rhizovicinus TaxID=242606 RepID=A0A4V6P427_9GAMM|nr:FAD-binding oxidoreductase [Luteibacter rhizovicinus]TCV92379.1 FAD/FMN-containing dehydrogenase [Luteibacter rhizovicinus]